MVENAILAVAGGALGFALADASLGLLLAFAPTQLPRGDIIRLEGTPFLIVAGVTIVAIVLFGVAPTIVSAARYGAPSSLRVNVRSGSESKGRRATTQSLVAAQVALALVMLSGAGLLIRSLAAIEHVDLGYAPAKLSLFSIAFPAKYADPARLLAFGDELMTRVRAIPGVEAVTPILVPPFIGANAFRAFVDVRGKPTPDSARVMVPLELAGSGYFDTFAVPVLRGRGIADSDREDAPPVAVVSERVAQRLWPNDDPIGKQIRYWGSDTTWRTVVGVAGDIRFRSLRDATSTIYLPWRQAGAWQGVYALRSRGRLAALLPAIRRAAIEIDPQVRIFDPRDMNDRLAAPLARPRLDTFLLSCFGLVALVLATIGLYGAIASTVRDQTRDIGVRMALGATPGRVRRAVLGRAAAVISAGAVVGIAASLATSRLLQGLLYQVSPTDPLALLGACLALMTVGAAAAYFPARRATKIDPVQALRAE